MAAEEDIVISDSIAPLAGESLFGLLDESPDDQSSIIIDFDPENLPAQDELGYLGQREFGITWSFDYPNRRFFTQGDSYQVLEVDGQSSFAEWVMATLHTERLSCFSVSDQVGVEFEEIVQSATGQIYAGALLRQTIEEALSVHDRYAGITEYEASVDGDFVYIKMTIDTTEGPVAIETRTS